MYTILVIEDNVSILENLTECLELEGYKTLMARDGKNGVQMANEFKPDLIICDILMPKMDGHEVLHSLFDTTRSFKIPFIFSSAISEKKDIVEALVSGADDYIVKPYQPEALLKIVKYWLQEGSKRDK
jgi:DNA-binding response OmpR family regulator